MPPPPFTRGIATALPHNCVTEGPPWPPFLWCRAPPNLALVCKRWFDAALAAGRIWELRVAAERDSLECLHSLSDFFSWLVEGGWEPRVRSLRLEVQPYDLTEKGETVALEMLCEGFAACGGIEELALQLELSTLAAPGPLLEQALQPLRCVRR